MCNDVGGAFAAVVADLRPAVKVHGSRGRGAVLEHSEQPKVDAEAVEGTSATAAQVT